MVSRTTVITLPLALSLLLAGCTSPSEAPAQSATPSAPASQTAEASAQPSPEPTETAAPKQDTQAAVEDLPDYLKPYPEAEVLSASRGKAEASADAKNLDQVSLVMKAKAKPEDIFKFYAKDLEKAGFETYGQEVKTDEARVANYRHKDNDGLLVVTISKDAKDSSSVVTVGGTVAP
ncbi:hypothetical protein [Brevibacterium sp.]|uniref:hypothetical protein n=1 Tax=Brevibacterium sp. TaxID=1701 RepID=UPI002810AE18|nr:hypothetical protein [Brevibacterium sp.]